MGRAPCCDKANVKRGPWSPEEDAKLKDYIGTFGTGGNWISLPQKAGLRRCGKSCRLRWLNYLRPNIKHGEFSQQEDTIICTLYATIGSRWSIIASQLPGRTDNDIKNYWNTKLKKKLMGINYSSNQRKLFLPFQNFIQPASSSQIQSSQSSMMPTLSQLFRDCSPFSTNLPPNHLSSTPFNHQYYSFEMQNNGLMSNGRCNNMVMFGGNNEAASCSSSDGSCSQMSFGNMKEVKQESMSYLGPECNFVPLSGTSSTIRSSSNGFQDEQKLIYGGTSCGDILSGTGNFGNNNHDLLLQGYYDHLEEVSNSSNNNNNSGSFYFNNYENKTYERSMYFDS